MKIFIPLLLLTACSTSSKIIIITKPEKASVSVYNDKTKNYDLLGETPLSLGGDELARREVGVLKVERRGHVTENIILPANSIGMTEINLNLKQNSDWIGKENKSLSLVAEEIAEGISQIQRLTNSRKYSNAMTVINKLINKYPETSIFYDIRGSIHLLLDQKEEARRNFQKSLEIQPGNLKTKALLEKI